MPGRRVDNEHRLRGTDYARPEPKAKSDPERRVQEDEEEEDEEDEDEEERNRAEEEGGGGERSTGVRIDLGVYG